MTAPFYVSPAALVMPEPPPSQAEVVDLLKQLLDVQREQVNLLKAQQAAQDQGARWRAFLARWSGEFPEVAAHCKEVLPALERAYLALNREMTERLRGDDADDLENEYALGEFLDRYGVRLGQLGNIIAQVGPLAEAAPPPKADEPGS